jgi:hypothetical protein
MRSLCVHPYTAASAFQAGVWITEEKLVLPWLHLQCMEVGEVAHRIVNSTDVELHVIAIPHDFASRNIKRSTGAAVLLPDQLPAQPKCCKKKREEHGSGRPPLIGSNPFPLYESHAL